jgi:uncharacterized protein DUF4157
MPAMRSPQLDVTPAKARTAATESVARQRRPGRPGDALLELQRRYGNRYVQRIVQAKLVVGPAHDHYEQQADDIARKAVATSDRGVPEAVERVRATGGGPAGPMVEQAVRRARGGGQAVPFALRNRVEQVSGADFRDVRVHADAEADHLNDALRSRAFTVGADVFVRRAEYRPGTSRGDELLAHELVHTVQQGYARTGNTRAATGGARVQRAWKTIAVRKYRRKHKDRENLGKEGKLVPTIALEGKESHGKANPVDNARSYDWADVAVQREQRNPVEDFWTHSSSDAGTTAHSLIQEHLSRSKKGLMMEFGIPSGASKKVTGYVDIAWIDGSNGYLADIKPHNPTRQTQYDGQLDRYVETANRYCKFGVGDDWHWQAGDLLVSGNINTLHRLTYLGKEYELRLTYRSVPGFVHYTWQLRVLATLGDKEWEKYALLATEQYDKGAPQKGTASSEMDI